LWLEFGEDVVGALGPHERFAAVDPRIDKGADGRCEVVGGRSNCGSVEY
jgi:hypothetical protein